MKQLILILTCLLLYICSSAAYIRSGDIYFEQDSVNPLQINITVVFKGVILVGFGVDSIPVYISSIDSFFQLPLSDTEEIRQGLYYKKYYASYILSDVDTGVVTIGAGGGASRYVGIYNMHNSQSASIWIETSFNADSLKGYLSYRSAYMLNTPEHFDTVEKTVVYDPLLVANSADSVYVELVTPLQFTDMAVPFYRLPYTLHPNDTFDVNTETGLLVWNKPLLTGLFCIAYKVSCYRNGVFVSSIMRDMLLYIGNYNATDIGDVPSDRFLSCYPNPTINLLHCSLSNDALNAQYSITNIQGADMGLPKAVPSSSFDVDVSQLPSGIYYLTIQADNQHHVKKFVKQ